MLGILRKYIKGSGIHSYVIPYIDRIVEIEQLLTDKNVKQK